MTAFRVPGMEAQWLLPPRGGTVVRAASSQRERSGRGLHGAVPDGRRAGPKPGLRVTTAPQPARAHTVSDKAHTPPLPAPGGRTARVDSRVPPEQTRTDAQFQELSVWSGRQGGWTRFPPAAREGGGGRRWLRPRVPAEDDLLATEACVSEMWPCPPPPPPTCW